MVFLSVFSKWKRDHHRHTSSTCRRGLPSVLGLFDLPSTDVVPLVEYAIRLISYLFVNLYMKNKGIFVQRPPGDTAVFTSESSKFSSTSMYFCSSGTPMNRTYHWRSEIIQVLPKVKALLLLYISTNIPRCPLRAAFFLLSFSLRSAPSGNNIV